MKKKFFKALLLFAGILSVIILIRYKNYHRQTENYIYIAIAGPITGEHTERGQSFLNGVRMYFDEINQKGGVNGKKVRIDFFGDKNDPAVAREMADQIVKDNRAVAVIGHYYSSCSKSAGEIYEKHGIPAVSPGSSPDISLTRDNEWYFRTCFNDNSQARFMANYAKKILKQDKASIIYEDSEYGSYLAEVFEQTSNSLDIEVKYKWDYNKKNLEQKLRGIIYALRTKRDAGIIFLAVRVAEGIKLRKLMKDILIQNPVILPDSFASKEFSHAFDKYPKEIRNPGFYTNGIYVATPLLFDTANARAQKFRDDYKKKYGEEPDWYSAFAFDTAMLIIEAVKNTGVHGTHHTIKNDRKKIRDYLASLSDVATAVEGITGLNYFDSIGNSARTVTIGVIKNKTIIPALTQLTPVINLGEIPDFKKALEQERVLLFNARYMYKTKVVYTGININKISELDTKGLTCLIDFDIWFRYKGETEAHNIEFLDAAEPVELGEPVKKEVKDSLHYYLYNVKARFKTDVPNVFGYHTLGIRLRHRKLIRSNLIYVTDVLGMGTREEVLKRMKTGRVLNPEYGYNLVRASFFQNAVEQRTLGSPEYLRLQKKALEYSQFNFQLGVRKDTFTLRGTFSYKDASWLAGVSCIILLLLECIGKGRVFQPFPKSVFFYKIIWFSRALSAFFLLLTGEVFVMRQITGMMADYIDITARMFDALWWIVPAYHLNLALEPFIWIPMERRDQRPVPRVLRRFVGYTVYFLACYGAVVFVFNLDITHLMATSGIIAMGVGLLIKSNISNFFAGIVINQGYSIKIGDSVKIGDNEEGQVVDITRLSTLLEKGDGSLLSIPNSIVLDSVIHNFDHPNEYYSSGFTVHADPVHPPERIRKILFDAVISAEGVLKDPKPVIRFKGFTEWSAEYSASFSIKDYSKKSSYNEAVWERVWRHLKIARVAPAIKHQGTQIIRGRSTGKTVTPLALLQEIDIFQPLAYDAKVYLSKKMRNQSFPPGHIIVQQDDIGDSLFIVAEGVVDVMMEYEQTGTIDIARMGAGSFFGEMALLTGEHRNATIISVTDTYLFEITKEDIAPLIEEQAEVSELLSKVLAERKAVIESKKQQVLTHIKTKSSDKILDRIRSFFGLKKANIEIKDLSLKKK
ncbi:MAG: ABC transporter substrate-binding protein [Desulfobacterales bacterium]|nr:ABC transporter substrate-binding protein [Desulfobacterales bacterium]